MKSYHLLSALGLAALVGVPAAAAAAPVLGAPPVSVPSVGVPALPNGGASRLPQSPVNLPNTTAPQTGAGASGSSAVQGSAGVTTTLGRISSVDAASMTLTLADGSTKTFALNSSAAAQLKAMNGLGVAVQTDAKGNVVAVLPANQRTLATVTSIANGSAVLKLSDGRTLNVAISPETAATLGLKAGSEVIVATRDAFRTATVYGTRTAATVVRVVKNRATLLLADGRKVTVALAGTQSARGSLKSGSRVTVTTDENGKTHIDSTTQRQ